MNKSITGAVLGVVAFLMAYCLCFWFQVMPKFYPLLGEIHVVAPPGKHIAVKFVGSAAVGMLGGLVGLVVGRRLPQRASGVVHLLAWAAMLAACVYLVGRETAEYIIR